MRSRAEVIVIGAGVAGLAAARVLAEAGVDVLMLEARDRIGGRLHTVPAAGGAIAELGAEFIHGKPPEILRLLKSAGLRKLEVSGDLWRLEEDGVFRKAERLLSKGENLLGRLRPGSRDLSLAALMRRRPQQFPRSIRPWLLAYVEGFHAADPEKISVRHLLAETKASEAIAGDSPSRLARGYSALAESILNAIPKPNFKLLLRQPVQEVHWEPGNVRLHSRDAEYRASRAIITVPLPLLSTPDGIRFSPPINKSFALRHIAMGPVIRITLAFEHRFWEKDLPRPPGSLPRLAFLFTQDRDFPTWWVPSSNHALLTGWAAGHYAVPLTGKTPEEVCRIAIASLSRIFRISPAALSRRLRGSYTHDWQSDPYSRGAYTYAVVGGAGAFRALARPVARTLFFAGEATNFQGHNGTVHGAIASGHRAAREVLLTLGLSQP